MREKTGPLKNKLKAIMDKHHNLNTMNDDLQKEIEFDSECAWYIEENKIDTI